jgi:hypothetical protein
MGYGFCASDVGRAVLCSWFLVNPLLEKNYPDSRESFTSLFYFSFLCLAEASRDGVDDLNIT